MVVIKIIVKAFFRMRPEFSPCIILFYFQVDELLGVRGPIVVLLRNLLWLLAFNGAYLGLFAFVPFSIGSSLVAAAARYFGDFGDFGGSSQSGSFSDNQSGGFEETAAETVAAALTASVEAADASVLASAGADSADSDFSTASEATSALSSSSASASVWVLLRELAATGRAEDHTLQLPDLATMALGYLATSVMVFAWRALLRAIVADRPGGNLDRVDVGLRDMGLRGANAGAGGGGGAVGGPNGGIPAPVDGLRGLAGPGGGGGNFSPLLRRLRLVLEGTAAVVKVGLLLFLKMLLLPLLLGVCLDTATLTLFAASGASRMQFTAQNLVASLLLHWVLGITFMLFVTVSVLQLREVNDKYSISHLTLLYF